MLFNSLDFAIFLPLVFLLYWFVVQRNLKFQNALLLVASYVFYGWWDWRFLSLIFISSIADYLIGIRLSETEHAPTRKWLLVMSLAINLGFLGFFKYFNFFIESFARFIEPLGFSPNVMTLHIILPVGISFYTFQTLSYTIDIYRKQLEPTRDIVGFFAFVSFFPQLVAGPIERAKHLLPQFEVPRSFDYEKAVDGLRQILWGLFKKIVIADTCAAEVEYIFNNYESLPGLRLFLGTVYFAFQIYGDFSGYSDIAIGTARLFGFDLMRNFAYPYFSRDIAEFWRRWHISLSSWFRDYVYIPLGGSRGPRFRRIINIVITFTVSGFWHGANWTFIAWGFLNGLYYIPLMLLNKQKTHTSIVAENRRFPSFSELVQMGVTFLITLVAWVFFRAATIQDALKYLWYMLSPERFGLAADQMNKQILLLLVLFVGIEWIQRKKQHGLQIDRMPLVVRKVIYVLFIFTVLLFFGKEQTFIYFQF